MAFTLLDVAAGQVDIYNVDTLGPGPLVGLAGAQPTSRGFTNFPGTVMRAFDPYLGAGEFIFARSSGTINYGTVCQQGIAVTASRTDLTMTAWAGTALSGVPLAIALTSLTVGQYGWYQIGGLAVTTVQGAPAVGGAAYWQAAGIVSPTLVASKQMLNSVFGSAVSSTIYAGATATTAYNPTNVASTGNTGGLLSATQALVLMNRSFAQGIIT